MKTKKKEAICRVCGKKFNTAKADKIYGANSERSMLKICSPGCYTKFIMDHK